VGCWQGMDSRSLGFGQYSRPHIEEVAPKVACCGPAVVVGAIQGARAGVDNVPSAGSKQTRSGWEPGLLNFDCGHTYTSVAPYFTAPKLAMAMSILHG
jgi:hypothetical protein